MIIRFRNAPQSWAYMYARALAQPRWPTCHSCPMYPLVYVVCFFALLGRNALCSFWLHKECPKACWIFLFRLSALEPLIFYLSIFLYSKPRTQPPQGLHAQGSGPAG